jgi:steroid delta-isomerase-like uncharacterized protein
MIIHDTATLVRTGYNLYNAHQTDPDWLDKFSALASEKCEVLVVANGQKYQGRNGFKQFVLGWSTAFPDSKVELTRVIATGDEAAVEFTARGTHTGVLQTPRGDIQPTGRKMEQRFCDIYRINNGQIVSLHCYYDARSFMEQLGLTQ